MKPYYESDGITIYHGRAEDVLPMLEAGSIDLVFSDPPYPREFLPCYETLARESARLCKPGAFVFAYIGAETLPEVMALMAPHLTWFWLVNVRHDGSIPRLWYKRLMVMSKPVLCFTNGTVPQTDLPWSASDYISEGRDKNWHEWGQSIGFAIRQIILRSQPGDLVLDPFMGGGTTLRAAKNLSRRAIGVEMSEEHCETAVLRLSQMVLPMEAAG